MTEILAMIAKFGLPTVAGAVLIYLVLRGEIQFHYPRRSDHRDNP